jgi:hypothetical protein
MPAHSDSRAGDIRTDMFQELLLADLVVVDLSIDNPNVWYELGVRHALRPGVAQHQTERQAGEQHWKAGAMRGALRGDKQRLRKNDRRTRPAAV